jgi:photosystem II stability/assembly factor-like uncharacterized protein
MKRKILLFCIITLLTSTNSIAQQWWVEQNSGVSSRLNSAYTGYFTSDGWVCGNNGTVLKTVNLGNTWLNVSGNGIPSDVLLVTIVAGWFNTYVVLTAGSRGDTTFVYRSTNQGQNWSQVFRQNGGRINAIGKINNGKVFMQGNPVGNRWSVWKSTNGGLTWDSSGMRLIQTGNETSANNSIASTSNAVVFGTDNGRLYFSSGNGANWRTILTPGETEPLAIDFSFTSDSVFNGYTGGNGILLYTSNSGTNWETLPSLLGSGVVGSITKRGLLIDLIDPYEVIYVRNDNKIYKKFPGSSWYVEYTAPSGNYTYTSKPMGDENIWAVRDNGGISYCNCAVTEVNSNANTFPCKYNLYQNYPNPFNPSTMIKFDIPKSSSVSLKIYNANGKEINTMVDMDLNRGMYSFVWNAGNYPSGVYFYKLNAAGYSETKKMVLIK